MRLIDPTIFIASPFYGLWRCSRIMGGDRIVNFKLYSLVRYLQKPGGVSVEELQEGLNVSRATVFRYLNIVQEMGLPLTNDTRGRKSYYFFDMSNPFVGRNIFENLPYIRDDFYFDKNEKMLIEYLFTNTEETVPALCDDIKKLHEKIQVLLTFAGHVAESDEERENGNLPSKQNMKKICSFNDLPKKTEEDKMAIIGKLCDAVAGKLVCTVTYRALNGSDKTYRIMPLVVFSYQGGIYTIVETEKYAYTSKLAVERIKSLTLTDETFERKTNLDIPWIMTDPFGLVQTDQFEAVIKVRKESVENIKAKAWPEERVTFSRPDEDGSITLKIITSGEFELIRWLRYMGPEVKLISPDWLVEKLKESIGDLNRNYDV